MPRKCRGASRGQGRLSRARRLPAVNAFTDSDLLSDSGGAFSEGESAITYAIIEFIAANIRMTDHVDV
jgi:hypothetical protein